MAGFDPIGESSCIAILFGMWERDEASLVKARVLSPTANVYWFKRRMRAIAVAWDVAGTVTGQIIFHGTVATPVYVIEDVLQRSTSVQS